MMAVIPPKFTYEGIDVDSLDPDRIAVTTCAQDCSQIAMIFERGAHSTPSEAAVFATLTRVLQNNKRLAAASVSSLEGYLYAPQESAAETARQAAQFGLSIGGASNGTQNDATMQSLNFGTQQQTTYGESFGSKLLELARDCIPCDLRINAFLELHPHVDLIGAFEAQVKAQLSMLGDLVGLLNNFDMYGDFCQLLGLLSFMCVPDLQRIIATLMALLLLDVPSLDGLIGMLQSLILPLFAPILMSITSLLDQFVVLVTNPLECIMVAIDLQAQKLGLSVDRNNALSQASAQISAGIQQLQGSLSEAKLRIEDKLRTYIGQMQAMMSEFGGGDTAYIAASLKKLQNVRMIAFIVAVISGIQKGHAACSASQPAGVSEIDNFFQTYLNPHAPFDLWVDESGQLHVDEKVEDREKMLINNENVIQFEGVSFLNSVSPQVEEVATQLLTPARILVPCKLELQKGTIDKVNDWITELGKTR